MTKAAPSADQVKNQGAASAPRWMVEKYATLIQTNFLPFQVSVQECPPVSVAG
jgi:hypothetical protein